MCPELNLVGDRLPSTTFPIAELRFGIPDAAYVHIPFCRRRCYYCDFPVSVVGDHAKGDSSGTIAQYVEILSQEIITTPNRGRSLKTVFFGGGTPSLLSAKQLAHILESLNCRFGIAADAEISIEMDPGTFDLEQLQGYRTAGVNRVSLGVQSFQAELLAACGRTHTPQDIYTAVDLIHQVNLPSFSLDLISGLPHQTLAQWQDSLQAALQLAPPHLSIYDLTVEPVTAFGRWYKPGDSPLPTEETTAQMYRLAQQVLTASGYAHYEISNYAKPGYQCRHNRVYWENRSYYGFGMGAASYIDGQRFTRPRKRHEYFQWVRELSIHQGEIAYPVTPAGEIVLDTLMLGLRLSEGVDLNDLESRFGQETVRKILTCLQPYQQCGWVEILDKSSSGSSEVELDPTQPRPQLQLRLSDPEGFLFSNVVLSSLFEHLGA